MTQENEHASRFKEVTDRQRDGQINERRIAVIMAPRYGDKKPSVRLPTWADMVFKLVTALYTVGKQRPGSDVSAQSSEAWSEEIRQTYTLTRQYTLHAQPCRHIHDYNHTHADPVVRVPSGPYKSLKVLKVHTFKYKALKSP